jgi:hypothetical protein
VREHDGCCVAHSYPKEAVHIMAQPSVLIPREPADITPPPRPLDTWRVCNNKISDGPDHGCTCPPWGASAAVAVAAAKRLRGEL